MIKKKLIPLFLLPLLLIPIFYAEALNVNVSGSVEDDTVATRPIIATVQLIEQDGTLHETTVKGSGTWNLSVPEGNYTISISDPTNSTLAKGYQPQFFQFTQDVIINSTNNSIFDLTIPNAHMVGVVKDGSNNALGGVFVDTRVLPLTIGSWNGFVRDTDTTRSTGSIGSYVLDASPITISELFMEFEGQPFFPTTGRQLTISAGTNTNDFVFAPKHTISSSLRMPTKIEYVCINYVSRTTSETGSFSFKTPEDICNLVFSDLIHNNTAIPTFFHAQKELNVTSSISENFQPLITTFTGTLRDEQSIILSDQDLRIRANLNMTDFIGFSGFRTTSDSNGLFTIKLLPMFENSINVNTKLPDNSTMIKSCTISGTTISC